MRSIQAHPPSLGDTYYVIIGCGLTAAVNYSTLLTRLQAGDDPFGGYEVLFIGQPEPWGDYEPLPMGQWPAILAAPSFRDQLQSLPQSDFLPSADFSGGIDSQWAWLYTQRSFRYSPGLVTSIAARGGNQGFDVTWKKPDGTMDGVHAAKVDVCGGPGPSRRLCDAQLDTSLRTYPKSPHLLETGESYLGKAATLAVPGEEVAIIGGGPTAAWCVERALANRNEVLWVSDKDVNPAFVSSRRNDALAAGTLSRVRQDRTTNVTYSVVPGSPHLRFVEFCDVLAVHDVPGAIGVKLMPKATGRIVDHRGVQQRFPRSGLVFTQVVLALGQETGFEADCKHAPGCTLRRETGSWATRLAGLIPQNPKQHLIVKDEIEVGLQSDDGSLRVLGSSFLAHPYADAVFNDSTSELFRYVGSLTEQAQVNRGASMAAMTTALANDYFDYQPNLNRNSATLRQLQAIQAFRPYADLVHDIRTRRIHPVTNDEAAAVDQYTSDRCT
jgi:hypothetical protein